MEKDYLTVSKVIRLYCRPDNGKSLIVEAVPNVKQESHLDLSNSKPEYFY